MADAKTVLADPLEIAVEEIPLPPEDIASEMLEDEIGAVARENATARRPAPEVAALEFVGGKPRSVTVPLDFPFRRGDETVTEITVRRLNGYEVAALAGRIVKPEGGYELYDVYAEMTGVPAAQLRGLDQDDGVAVLEACRDFLPRIMRADG